jgi:hypothetical protein
MSAIVVTLSGCPAESETTKPAESPLKKRSKVEFPPEEPIGRPKTDERAAKHPPTTNKATTPAEKVAQDVEEAAKKPRDAGPPLVDDPKSLIPLQATAPVWIDNKNKWVVLQGEVCSVDYPLEFFVSIPTKAYESVLSVDVEAWIVHSALLRVGAEAGHPARFDANVSPPKFVPPTGTEIAIEVRWKDADGKVQSASAQQWVRDIKTKKALNANWVFAGSVFVTNQETGKEHYAADGGELICALSSPYAMLDLPMFGYGAIEARSFEAFKEHIPPRGTSVTLLLKPILSTNPSAKRAPAAKPPAETGNRNKHAAAEQKAVDAAEPWLALVDRGEYSQAWETAAGFLKDRAERREFIKVVGDKRKPLGKLISRKLESMLYATSLPGAPDGQYVVLQYKTSFANKKRAIETVVPMLDNDRKWRVSGYQIN